MSVSKTLTHTAAARRLVAILRRPMTVQENDRLRAWYPRGVPEGELQAIATKLSRPRPQLVVIK